METRDIDELLEDAAVPDEPDNRRDDAFAETDTFGELIAPELIFPMGER